jgi:hypothetical protein
MEPEVYVTINKVKFKVWDECESEFFQTACWCIFEAFTCGELYPCAAHAIFHQQLICYTDQKEPWCEVVTVTGTTSDPLRRLGSATAYILDRPINEYTQVRNSDIIAVSDSLLKLTGDRTYGDDYCMEKFLVFDKVKVAPWAREQRLGGCKLQVSHIGEKV